MDNRIHALQKLIADERSFIAARGDCLAGYAAFYTNRTPENVEAIYNSDRRYLATLEERLRKLMDKKSARAARL